jgi:hypothetical protein
MKDDDLIRRNRGLLARESTREAVAAVLDQRSKSDHARSRMRKQSRAHALWPHFMQRLIGVPKHAPDARRTAILLEGSTEVFCL